LIIALAVTSVMAFVCTYPLLIALIHVDFPSKVNHYASWPLPSMTPGLLVKVYLVNSTSIKPWVLSSMFTLTPNDILPMLP